MCKSEKAGRRSTVQKESDPFWTEAIAEADLVTKKDLQIGLAPLYADLTLVKWMLGILLGGAVALILKTFFPLG